MLTQRFQRQEKASPQSTRRTAAEVAEESLTIRGLRVQKRWVEIFMKSNSDALLFAISAAVLCELGGKKSRSNRERHASISAMGTGLYSRPITTIPESVTCHPRARSASRS